MSHTSGIKKNLFYSFGYQFLEIVLPLITAPYIARVLGANSLGVYSKTHAFAQYFYLFSMLGVKNYGNRAIARVRDNGDELNKTFWEIYFFQLITGVVFSILYVIYCVTICKQDQYVYLLQTIYVLSGLFDINWACFGLEKFRLITIRGMCVRILSAIAIFAFVKDVSDLGLYTVIIASSIFLSCVVAWPFILKHIKFVKPYWNGIKKHIKPNLILFWPIIAVSIYNLMDKLMLGYFSTNEEVAFYANAEKIVTIPNTIILALDNVIMPRMSNLFAKEEKQEKIKYLMDTVMMFAMFMAAAMAFGVAGVSDVFAPWFYGKEFTRCGYFILLLSPIIIFRGWAGVLRTQFIIPTGRDKIYVVSLTVGAVVNLIINALLIPSMNGVGAIIGTIVAEFAVCFIQFVWCKEHIDFKGYMINGFSFCVIGGVMFFAVEALSHVSRNALTTMAIQVFCGGTLYLVLASIYMIKIRKNPILVNEGLKMLRIKYRFK
ncbi:Membrane protein involved in the export of O-antigen and teichoic acid [Lachnospiraceae bacterium NE2001]|nr:Membrane protein involved in the export of O-antigen and teichoic acid [Lachnospiraceae bacterium NE2001]